MKQFKLSCVFYLFYQATNQDIKLSKKYNAIKIVSFTLRYVIRCGLLILYILRTKYNHYCMSDMLNAFYSEHLVSPVNDSSNICIIQLCMCKNICFQIAFFDFRCKISSREKLLQNEI